MDDNDPATRPQDLEERLRKAEENAAKAQEALTTMQEQLRVVDKTREELQVRNEKLEQAVSDLRRAQTFAPVIYHRIMNALPTPAHVVDERLTIVSANRALTNWCLDLNSQGSHIAIPLEGKHVREAFPFLPASVEQEYRAVFESGLPLHTEERSAIQNENVWTRTSKIPLNDPDGKYVLTVLDNITRRKFLEANLDEQQRLIQVLAENTHNPMFIKNRNHQIIYSNPAHLAQLGVRTMEDVIGKTDADFFPTGLADAFGADEEEIIASGKPIINRIEDSYHFGRDEAVIYLTTKTPWIVNGDVVGVIGSVQDITELRKARNELARSAQLNAEIVNNAQEGIVVYTVNKKGELVHARWNNFMKTLCGVSEEEVLGKNSFHAFPQLKNAALDGLMTRALQGETVVTKEDIPIEVRDGRRIWVSCAYAPHRDETGAIVGVLEMVRDVTERRKLEGAMRHANALEIIGTMAAGVAHNFNQHLTVMQGYAEMITNDPLTESSTRGHADKILKATGKASKITRQMLQMSKHSVDNPVVLDANAVLRDTKNTIIGPSMEKSIILDYHLSQEPCVVKVELSSLEQAIINLAFNARDAIEGNGTITFTTSAQNVDAAMASRHLDASPGDYVCIEVADTGKGIKNDDLLRIFTPFYTTKGPKGTGLGLPYTYGVARRYGGFMTVESKEGSGTRIRMYLPRSSEPLLTQTQMLAVTQARHGQGTVIVVDDEPNILELCVDFLVTAGYDVKQFDGPTAALEASKTYSNLDALLTDCQMSEMSGFDLAASMRKQWSGLPVVYMSGFTRDTLPAAEMMATDEFLSKPFAMDALVKAVNRAISRHNSQ